MATKAGQDLARGMFRQTRIFRAAAAVRSRIWICNLLAG